MLEEMEEKLRDLRRSLMETESILYHFTEKRVALSNMILAIEDSITGLRAEEGEGEKDAHNT